MQPLGVEAPSEFVRHYNFQTALLKVILLFGTTHTWWCRKWTMPRVADSFIPWACRWWLSWPSRRRRRGHRVDVHSRRGSDLWGCCLVCYLESWCKRDTSRNTHIHVFLCQVQKAVDPPIPTYPYEVLVFLNLLENSWNMSIKDLKQIWEVLLHEQPTKIIPTSLTLKLPQCQKCNIQNDLSNNREHYFLGDGLELNWWSGNSISMHCLTFAESS